MLRCLRDRSLLVKRGSGNRTYYTLNTINTKGHLVSGQMRLPFSDEPTQPEGGKLGHTELPTALAAKLPQVGQRIKTTELRELICQLCIWQPLTGDVLAMLLNKDLKYLRNKHLTQMVQSGQLGLLYPESPNHPNQAYLTPEQDKRQDS